MYIKERPPPPFDHRTCVVYLWSSEGGRRIEEQISKGTISIALGYSFGYSLDFDSDVLMYIELSLSHI